MAQNYLAQGLKGFTDPILGEMKSKRDKAAKFKAEEQEREFEMKKMDKAADLKRALAKEKQAYDVSAAELKHKRDVSAASKVSEEKKAAAALKESDADWDRDVKAQTEAGKTGKSYDAKYWMDQGYDFEKASKLDMIGQGVETQYESEIIKSQAEASREELKARNESKELGLKIAKLEEEAKTRPLTEKRNNDLHNAKLEKHKLDMKATRALIGQRQRSNQPPDPTDPDAKPETGPERKVREMVESEEYYTGLSSYEPLPPIDSIEVKAAQHRFESYLRGDLGPRTKEMDAKIGKEMADAGKIKQAAAAEAELTELAPGAMNAPFHVKMNEENYLGSLVLEDGKLKPSKDTDQYAKKIPADRRDELISYKKLLFKRAAK